jgi:hypothetical protein
MTRDQLKNKIKKTFGTYSKFCKLAKIDRYHFQRDFLEARHIEAMDMADIEGLVVSLSDQTLTLPDIQGCLSSAGKTSDLSRVA